jgi:hypothetical protein
MRTEFLKPSPTWSADKRYDRLLAIGAPTDPPAAFRSCKAPATVTGGLATTEERVDLVVLI